MVTDTSEERYISTRLQLPTQQNTTKWTALYHSKAGNTALHKTTQTISKTQISPQNSARESQTPIHNTMNPFLLLLLTTPLASALPGYPKPHEQSYPGWYPDWDPARPYLDGPKSRPAGTTRGRGRWRFNAEGDEWRVFNYPLKTPMHVLDAAKAAIVQAGGRIVQDCYPDKYVWFLPLPHSHSSLSSFWDFAKTAAGVM
jgi:hypothetical protein